MGEEAAARDRQLQRVLNPVQPTNPPRRQLEAPTNPPRKMDAPLLPFFLQTAPSHVKEPDGIFKPPVEDDQEPMFAMVFGRTASAPASAPSDHEAPAPASVALDENESDEWETGE